MLMLLDVEELKVEDALEVEGEVEVEGLDGPVDVDEAVVVVAEVPVAEVAVVDVVEEVDTEVERLVVVVVLPLGASEIGPVPVLVSVLDWLLELALLDGAVAMAGAGPPGLGLPEVAGVVPVVGAPVAGAPLDGVLAAGAEEPGATVVGVEDTGSCGSVVGGT